jgi:hypothetical protein
MHFPYVGRSKFRVLSQTTVKETCPAFLRTDDDEIGQRTVSRLLAGSLAVPTRRLFGIAILGHPGFDSLTRFVTVALLFIHLSSGIRGMRVRASCGRILKGDQTAGQRAKVPA